MAFQSYVFQVAFGLGALGSHITKLVEVGGASQRIFELLERPPVKKIFFIMRTLTKHAIKKVHHFVSYQVIRSLLFSISSA
jgi:hypothetical protein